VICAVLGCEIGEVLIPEPGKASAPGPGKAISAVGGGQAVTPKRRDGRTLPPV
jgi:hypothetical protein